MSLRIGRNTGTTVVVVTELRLKDFLSREKLQEIQPAHLAEADRICGDFFSQKTPARAEEILALIRQKALPPKDGVRTPDLFSFDLARTLGELIYTEGSSLQRITDQDAAKLKAEYLRFQVLFNKQSPDIGGIVQRLFNEIFQHANNSRTGIPTAAICAVLQISKEKEWPCDDYMERYLAWLDRDPAPTMREIETVITLLGKYMEQPQASARHLHFMEALNNRCDRLNPPSHELNEIYRQIQECVAFITFKQLVHNLTHRQLHDHMNPETPLCRTMHQSKTLARLVENAYQNFYTKRPKLSEDILFRVVHLQFLSLFDKAIYHVFNRSLVKDCFDQILVMTERKKCLIPPDALLAMVHIETDSEEVLDQRRRYLGRYRVSLDDCQRVCPNQEIIARMQKETDEFLQEPSNNNRQCTLTFLKKQQQHARILRVGTTT